MQETAFEKLIHGVVFLAICAGVIFVGWHEPLSYRFMSPRSIAELEGPVVDQAALERQKHPQNWNPGGTSLDRAPWEKKGNTVYYHRDSIDSRELGLPTESDRRGGDIGK
jgi:hypothetical protein